MGYFHRPVSKVMAHKAHTLLDTDDHYDAWKTGRDGPENWQDGQGLRIEYDGTGTGPSVTINGPDGEIDLFGLSEIRAVFDAVRSSLRYAEAFGDVIPVEDWRKQHDD